MACYEGIDTSGRTPAALHDAAVEALREARTPADAALARKAMQDAYNPAMSDQRAVICNQAGGGPEQFKQCMSAHAPAANVKMTVPCQQNLGDGKILLDGRYVPTSARYNILHYQPQSPNENGWTHGQCEIAAVNAP